MRDICGGGNQLGRMCQSVNQRGIKVKVLTSRYEDFIIYIGPKRHALTQFPTRRDKMKITTKLVRSHDDPKYRFREHSILEDGYGTGYYVHKGGNHTPELTDPKGNVTTLSHNDLRKALAEARRIVRKALK